MATKAVQVSLDQTLLKRIDADPDVKKRGRSAFVREALHLYLRARKRMQVDDEIRAAYSGRADAMLTEIENLIETQTWPDE